jgi:hypothetical protein
MKPRRAKSTKEEMVLTLFNMMVDILTYYGHRTAV